MADADYTLAPGALRDKPAVTPEAAQQRSFVLTEHLVAATRPGSIQAESFRALRSNLLSQHVSRGRRALAICAPAPEAGCSFVAANLAFIMAQAGVNTLLIDGNLREPGAHQFIASDQYGPGLGECLADDTLPLATAIKRVQPSLSVLYAGNAGIAAADRLGSSVFRNLVSQCLRDFDLTIIDTPPSSLSADARRIAAVTHYAMVVTRRDRTFVKDVQVLLDELAADGAEAIGTYLNDF
ncbi:MAG: diutan polysaccharide export protein [Sphingomonadaceae bacterium]|nr:diutan polysaccharide export protein [Sphingomonadaceae bacterium]